MWRACLPPRGRMFFQRIKTPGIAHNAYLLGDKEQAILVDPRRDIEEYLKVARENDLIIKYVLETHRQEDFVIGSKAIAERTDAKIVSLDHELFGHSDIRLKDGEKLTAGGLVIQALHTPGHTPESTCYALFLKADPRSSVGRTHRRYAVHRRDRPHRPDRSEEDARARRHPVRCHPREAASARRSNSAVACARLGIRVRRQHRRARRIDARSGTLL